MDGLYYLVSTIVSVMFILQSNNQILLVLYLLVSHFLLQNILYKFVVQFVIIYVWTSILDSLFDVMKNLHILTVNTHSFRVYSVHHQAIN